LEWFVDKVFFGLLRFSYLSDCILVALLQKGMFSETKNNEQVNKPFLNLNFWSILFDLLFILLRITNRFSRLCVQITGADYAGRFVSLYFAVLFSE